MESLQNLSKKISPEKFFLITAFSFGIFFLFCTPPLQVPDEQNHFYRAWQISEGGLISVKSDKRVGGYLPASLEQVTAPFKSMIWAKDRKITDMDMTGLLQAPLNPNERKFLDFNNTAMYSPVCYIPSSFSIFILKRFIPPLYVFYAARLATLLFWIILVYISIRIVPVSKWLFTFLALLPMSLFENMSISADVVTNAISFLFIAFVMKLAYTHIAFNSRTLILLCSLAFLVVSLKSVYAFLVLLLFTIPPDKFKTTKDYFLKLGLPFLTGVVFFIMWSKLMNPLYLSYENYNENFRNDAALVNGADMPRQIEYITKNVFYIVMVLLNSFVAAFDMYFPGYIGVFGWLDVPLASGIIYLAYMILLFTALSDNDINIRIRPWQKLIFFGVFCIIIVLVFVSQHLIWDPVGGDKILNIQGRYLIPCVPLLFVLFYNRLAEGKKYIVPLSALSFIGILLYSCTVLYSRYF